MSRTLVSFLLLYFSFQTKHSHSCTAVVFWRSSLDLYWFFPFLCLLNYSMHHQSLCFLPICQKYLTNMRRIFEERKKNKKKRERLSNSFRGNFRVGKKKKKKKRKEKKKRAHKCSPSTCSKQRPSLPRPCARPSARSSSSSSLVLLLFL